MINAATTPTVMIGAENIAARAMDNTLEGAGTRMLTNARATANAMGVTEQSAPRATEIILPGRTSGTVYKGSTTAKGAGKTGTVTRGMRGGYSKNSSAKGAYKNSSSYTPEGELKHVEVKTPIVPSSGFTGTDY